jgi:hypothetical protein
VRGDLGADVVVGGVEAEVEVLRVVEEARLGEGARLLAGSSISPSTVIAAARGTASASRSIACPVVRSARPQPRSAARRRLARFTAPASRPP